MAQLSAVVNDDLSETLSKCAKLSDESLCDCDQAYAPIIEQFKGSFDNQTFETWIHQWEMAASKYNLPASRWIYSVGFHLEGEALMAYAKITTQSDDWNNFRVSMIATFDSISPVIAFMRTKYSVCFGIDRYFHDRKYFAQLAGFTEQQAVEMMIENLDFEFKKQLQNQKITSFDHFYGKAKLIEKKLNEQIEPSSSEVIHLNPPKRRRSRKRSTRKPKDSISLST